MNIVISFRNYIIKKLDEKVLSTSIFEMAVDRQMFIRGFVSEMNNVIINYILVRYCTTRKDHFDSRHHWCSELIAAYDNYSENIIKKDKNKSISIKAIKQTAYDFECFDENKIYKKLLNKIRSEENNPNALKHIEFDLDIIKELCNEFAENYESIFLLPYSMKYDEMIEYIYNEL